MSAAEPERDGRWIGGSRPGGPPGTPEDAALSAQDLAELHEPLRRFLLRQTRDPHEAEDLTQETLARVWASRARLDADAALPYALTTARNLLRSEQRRLQVERRHQHRLLDPASPPDPQTVLVRAEEREAVRTALGALDVTDHALLAAHYGEQPGNGSLGPTGAGGSRRVARAPSRGPGVSSRLARARARARVDYLLALRRLEVSDPQCRAVLESLSSGDRRLQARTGASEHAATCPVCRDCADALTGRRRALFGVLPVPLLLLQPWRRAFRRAPRSTVTASALTGAAAVTSVLLLLGPTTGPAPRADAAVAAARGVPPSIGRAGAGAGFTVTRGALPGALVGGAALAPVKATNVGTAAGAVSPPTGADSEAKTAAGNAAPGTAGTVLFATDEPTPDAYGQQVIAAAARQLKTSGVTMVEVRGYTDKVAGAAVNDPLSAQRASNVAAALRPLLPGVTVTSAAKGEGDPVATNDTAAGRQQNRRVVIAATG